MPRRLGHSIARLFSSSSALRCRSAQAQTPAVDPAAVKALEAMSAHLRGLKSFQVESSTTTDEVLSDGLVLHVQRERELPRPDAQPGCGST